MATAILIFLNASMLIGLILIAIHGINYFVKNFNQFEQALEKKEKQRELGYVTADDGLTFTGNRSELSDISEQEITLFKGVMMNGYLELEKQFMWIVAYDVAKKYAERLANIGILVSEEEKTIVEKMFKSIANRFPELHIHGMDEDIEKFIDFEITTTINAVRRRLR